MIHELKIHPQYFDAVQNGSKTFEIRRNDRMFVKGDYLHLKEWSPEKSSYTGKELKVLVTYVTPDGTVGVPKDYVIMSIVHAEPKLDTQNQPDFPNTAIGYSGRLPRHNIREDDDK